MMESFTVGEDGRWGVWSPIIHQFYSQFWENLNYEGSLEDGICSMLSTHNPRVEDEVGSQQPDFKKSPVSLG